MSGAVRYGLRRVAASLAASSSTSLLLSSPSTILSRFPNGVTGARLLRFSVCTAGTGLATAGSRCETACLEESSIFLPDFGKPRCEFSFSASSWPSLRPPLSRRLLQPHHCPHQIQKHPYRAAGAGATGAGLTARPLMRLADLHQIRHPVDKLDWRSMWAPHNRLGRVPKEPLQWLQEAQGQCWR